MQRELVLGMGLVLGGLLVWNAWSLTQLQKRVDALESPAAAGGPLDRNSARVVQAAGAAAQARDNATPPDPSQGDPSPGSVPEAGRAENAAAATQGAPTAPSAVSVLGLDDPAAQTELDAYLDQYLDQREAKRDEEGTTEWLSHMDMVLDSFGDEFALEAGTTAAIKDKLMETTVEWVANDEAIGEGKITEREGHERALAMEEEVMFFLQDQLGEENAEVLAGRLW